MNKRTAIVLQNYLWAERRVTPVCTSDQKTKQTVGMQTGRVFTGHIFFYFIGCALHYYASLLNTKHELSSGHFRISITIL